jgi:hypothetical protein
MQPAQHVSWDRSSGELVKGFHTSRTECGGHLFLCAPPVWEGGIDKRPALFGDADNARAAVGITRANRNPTLVLQQREVAGERGAFQPQCIGKRAQRGRPAKDQIGQDGELGDTHSMRAQSAVIDRRDGPRGLARGNAKAGHTVGDIGVGGHN